MKFTLVLRCYISVTAYRMTYQRVSLKPSLGTLYRKRYRQKCLPKQKEQFCKFPQCYTKVPVLQKRIMIKHIKPSQWKTIRWRSFSVRQAFITCDIDSRRRGRVQSKYIILYMQMIPIPLQPNSLPGHALWVIKRANFSQTLRNKIYSYDIIWSIFPFSNTFYLQKSLFMFK